MIDDRLGSVPTVDEVGVAPETTAPAMPVYAEALREITLAAIVTLAPLRSRRFRRLGELRDGRREWRAAAA
jgi:hypothetical protein